MLLMCGSSSYTVLRIIFFFKIRSRFGPKLPSTNITYFALNIVICLETGHTTQMDPNGYFMLFL